MGSNSSGTRASLALVSDNVISYVMTSLVLVCNDVIGSCKLWRHWLVYVMTSLALVSNGVTGSCTWKTSLAGVMTSLALVSDGAIGPCT